MIDPQRYPDDLERRRRRAAYRAAHRGTKEMDWVIGRFAESRLWSMTAEQLGVFETLLAVPDPDLQRWVLTATPEPIGDLADLVAELRAFHGLGLELAQRAAD